MNREVEAMKRKGVLLSFMILLAAWPYPARSQNFNSSFPRVGVVTFYDANVGEAIWRNHDLVVIRFYQNELARRLKQQNPDVVVLAATDDLVDNDGVIAQMPEAWHTKKANGERVFAGEGWWLNITRFCPRVTFTHGGKTYNNANASEFFAGYFQNAVDWRYFDGVFFDSWANTIRYIGDDEYNAIDFDGNGTADNAQGQGQHLADQRWQEGNRLLIAELRKQLPNKVFAAHEAGPEEASFLNGLGMEGWKGGAWSWVFTSLLGPFRSGSGPQPRVNFVEVAGAKDSFQRMRYGLATACMTGAYVGVDEGLWAHRYTYLYDEYIADLGQPLGEPQQISALGEVWVRYFDKGAVICNGSGRPQTVRASHLTGGPYYKFQGGQVPAINDGRMFESVALSGAGDQSSSAQEGDGIVLFRRPTVLVTDIVIDNVDINMTSPGNNPVVYQGAWREQPFGEVGSTIAYSLSYGWDEYASPYAYTSSGNGENTATYAPTIGVPGRYEVFEWHPWHGPEPGSFQEASRVPYMIHHREGTAAGTIDQTNNHGQWNSLGSFYFNAGQTGKVVLSNKDAGGVVISDAIKFVCRENTVQSPPPPNADRTPPTPPTGVKVKDGGQ